MPTEHFKSAEAYRKWTAYRHIHGIPAPHLQTAIVAGKPHRVKHSELSLPEIHARGARTNQQGEIERSGPNPAKVRRMEESTARRNFYGD